MTTSRGFTLIEVLLVVLLIGIVSGIVLLAATPNDSSRLVANETERLADILALAIDESISDNEQIGVLIEETGYRFLSFDEKTRQWLPSTNSLLVDYELPSSLSIHINKQDNTKKMSLAKDSKKDVLQPQILLLSSGETSAVELELSAEDGSKQSLILNELGFIQLSTDSNEQQTQ
ncbi:type II secretion system minor pseudopilin GspH [Agitococcus lubricus]|nr:type II secretion system minor pseudopilin GspH [Agitococcus lubricus]